MTTPAIELESVHVRFGEVHAVRGVSLSVAPGELDYKSRLQERLQVGGGQPPEYRLIGTEGPDHQRVFDVEVHADDALLGQGRGRSKSDAEQAAAKDALDQLSINPR